MTPDQYRELAEFVAMKFERVQSDLQRGLEDVRSGFHSALEVTTESLRGDFRALDEKFELRMDRVDARLDGLTERADGVDIRLGVLAERADGVDMRLGVLAERVDGVDTRLGVLTERVDEMNTRLGVLTERVDGVDTGLGVLTDRIDRFIGAP